MKSILATTAISVAFAVSAGAAFAATWDFAQDAEDFFDENKYEGSVDQVYGENGDAISAGTNGRNTQGGITVNASASLHPPVNVLQPLNVLQSVDDLVRPIEPLVYPFMDSRGNDKANGDPGDDFAGLGVCKSGFDDGFSECSTNKGSNTGDDNLVFPELLKLSFGEDEVKLTELFIRDAGHDPITAEHGIIIMTEVTRAHPRDVNYFAVENGYVLGLDSLPFSDQFYFTSAYKCDEYQVSEVTSDNGYIGEPKCSSGSEIYLSTLSATAVPLPAAGWLLLGGLGGLVAMKRRRKT